MRSEALVGIDVSPKMLAHARERFPMSRFIEADFLADHWFDELGSISSRKTQQSDEGLSPNNFSGTPRFDLVVKFFSLFTCKNKRCHKQWKQTKSCIPLNVINAGSKIG